MQSPDIAHLRAFVAVAESRSYRRAATQLGVSPSAVSQSVRALEKRLGVPLLRRTTRSVAVTEAGAQLQAQLRRHLDGLDAALLQVSGLGEHVAGTLKLNVPRSAARILLEPLVGPFLAAHPHIRLELTTQDGFVDIVESGCDAGIRFAESVPRDMVALPIGPAQRFVVVSSPAFVRRHGRPAEPWALLTAPCVQLRFPSGALYRWEFEREGRPFALELQGPLTVDEHTMALRAALDGVGWAYLYEAMAQPHIDSGALVPVLEEWWPAGTPFHLYYPDRRQTSPALRALIDWLKAPEAGRQLAR
ncbi:MAG: LysR family transcriptional regulator [Gemmatimonadales bacterium]|nr:LysR family transcriptional regulator [Gemmatimonadales bacterium]